MLKYAPRTFDDEGVLRDVRCTPKKTGNHLHSITNTGARQSDRPAVLADPTTH